MSASRISKYWNIFYLPPLRESHNTGMKVWPSPAAQRDWQDSGGGAAAAQRQGQQRRRGQGGGQYSLQNHPGLNIVFEVFDDIMISSRYHF